MPLHRLTRTILAPVSCEKTGSAGIARAMPSLAGEKAPQGHATYCALERSLAYRLPASKRLHRGPLLHRVERPIPRRVHVPSVNHPTL